MLTAFYSARLFADFGIRAGGPGAQISSREISFRALKRKAGLHFLKNQNLHTSSVRPRNHLFCGPEGRICIIFAIFDRKLVHIGARRAPKKVAFGDKFQILVGRANLMVNNRLLTISSVLWAQI